MKSKKEEILEIASEQFHEFGFKGTTLQMIASKLGMEAPSLYNHIKSKNELLSNILVPVGEKFVQQMNIVKSSSLSPLEKLKKLISIHIEFSVENPHGMALSLRDWNYLDKSNQKEFLSLKDAYETDFVQILNDAIKTRQVKEIDVQILLFNILSTLRSLYAFCLKYNNYNTIDLEEQLRESLLKGIEY